MQIAFAGLGVMGGPMAGHLIRTGHEVRGFNRTFAKTHKWAVEFGGTACESVEQAVEGVDALLMCVGRDEDVKNTVLAALQHLKPGALIIDHTTISAKMTREVAALCDDKGFVFYDAPVSGGQVGAETGQLAIMVGGPNSRIAEVEALCKPYTKSFTHIGPSGAGQTAKMANQIAIAGVVQAVAEAAHFTRCAGLDPDLVVSAIANGAAGSWQMSNRWGTMNEGKYDFGFAVEWIRKDLGIALDEARTNGAHLAVTALIDQFYSEVEAMGGSRWDTSSLHARLESRRTQNKLKN